MNKLLAVEEEPEKCKNSGLTGKPEFFSRSLRLRISCWIHYIALEKHDHSSTSVITRPIVKHTSCFVLKPQITNNLLAKRSLQKTTCGHPAWLDQQNIILTRSSLIIIQPFPLRNTELHEMTTKTKNVSRRNISITSRSETAHLLLGIILEKTKLHYYFLTSNTCD